MGPRLRRRGHDRLASRRTGHGSGAKGGEESALSAVMGWPTLLILWLGCAAALLTRLTSYPPHAFRAAPPARSLMFNHAYLPGVINRADDVHGALPESKMWKKDGGWGPLLPFAQWPEYARLSKALPDIQKLLSSVDVLGARKGRGHGVGAGAAGEGSGLGLGCALDLWSLLGVAAGHAGRDWGRRWGWRNKWAGPPQAPGGWLQVDASVCCRVILRPIAVAPLTPNATPGAPAHRHAHTLAPPPRRVVLRAYLGQPQAPGARELRRQVRR